MKTIKYEKLSDELIKRFPTFKDKYDHILSYFKPDKPGPHVVYGDILNPYLTSLLENSDQNKYELQQIFDFLELLSNHEDLHIQEIVQMTILEYIGGKKELELEAKKFMGSKTKVLYDEIQRFWDRKNKYK